MRQLIATHWHPDHIGGMAGLQRATGATAAAHRIEAAAIAGVPGLAIPHPAPARHRWLRPILWPVLTPLSPPETPAAKAAVRKLAELDFEVICFGHFQPMRRGARAALRSRAEYVQWVFSARAGSGGR